MYSRTATQFDLMMKTIMIVLFVFGLFIFFVDVTKAAELWVTNPALCPATSPSFPGQNCTPQNICGDLSGTAQCFTTAGLIPPSVSSTSNVNYSSSFSGGYLINCFATDDGAGARCDNNGNFWCDRNETCYGTNHKETVCTENVWGTSACGNNCISGYQDCDATPSVCEVQTNSTNCSVGANNNIGASCTCQCDTNYVDCNASGPGAGDGCEVNVGVTTCTGAGGLQGVYNGSCQCIIATSTFVTGIEAIFATTSPLLWGRQYGEGDLINFGNATSSNIFIVKNDGTVFMTSTSATSSAPNQFYNYNGDLYWGETKLNTGGGVYTAGSGLNLSGYEFTVSTTQDFSWSGQHTFNMTTTFPLGVWGADGKVGINTTTLNYALNVQMDVGTYGGFGIYGSNGNLLGGFGNMDFTGVTSNGAVGLYYENFDPSQPHTMLAASGHSFFASSTLAIGSTTGDDGWDSMLMVEGGMHIENGVLRFNGNAGVQRQILMVSSSGYPEWTNTSSLGMIPSGTRGQILYYASNGNVLTATSAIFVSSTSGYVGINTVNPRASLEVDGNFTSVLLNNGSVIVRKDDSPSIGSWARAMLNFQEDDSTTIYQIGARGNDNTFNYGYLGYAYNSTTIRWYQNKIVSFDGNVGIGTTTPGATLTVDGQMLITQTSTMHNVMPEITETYSLGNSLLRWLTGWFKNLFADEATIVSSTIITANIGTSTIANATITSSTITNLNVTNATFTAQVAFQATSTHNSGIRSNLYCDVNGTNCFDPTLGWVVPITDVTTTPITTNGDFSSGILKGYQAANAICNYYYPGYHFCFSGEIISFIRVNNFSKFSGLPQAWIAEGPPGYTAYANDCGGYTTSSLNYLGAFWEYTGTVGGGQGWLSTCVSSKAISCCK
ncbi:MAG TPA: hypothetical protein P5230_03200 [Candidatus Magasanikbacteria bacterium]|nr:hypothetical protein [Candidatus Magasanikbacteria bacterium]